jgi:hypothetical protein
MTKSKVIHYGYENTYPESNEPSDWGTSCGLTSFENYTQDKNQVTCKRCLKAMRKNLNEYGKQLLTFLRSDPAYASRLDNEGSANW